MKLKRYEGNPILSPNPANPWEDLAVFNPAAWYDQDKKQVQLLYRAAESHPEYKCYFGLATSTDGFNFKRVSNEPVFSPSVDGFDAGTVQDPRMVKMGDWYYITYACRFFPFGQFWMPKEQQYKHPVCPPDCTAANPRNDNLRSRGVRVVGKPSNLYRTPLIPPKRL